MSFLNSGIPHSHQIFFIFLPQDASKHLRKNQTKKFYHELLSWLANLRELVDAVEVGKGLGDTLGHGLLALTDPDTGVVEPG